MEALCETIEKNLQSMQRDSLGDVRRFEEIA
jgi:putative membrane protein